MGMPERGEGPPPDENVIKFDPNEQLIKRLERTGEMDDIKAKAGDEMARYNERKKEGKETFGKWSVWVIDDRQDGHDNVRHIITREEDGSLALGPNNAESSEQEAVFASDWQAENEIEKLKKLFPSIEKKGWHWDILCGGLTEEQPDDPKKPDLKIVPKPKKE